MRRSLFFIVAAFFLSSPFLTYAVVTMTQTYVVASNQGSANVFGRGLAIDSSYFYVGGGDDAPGNYQWHIEKRNLSDGSLEYATTSNPSSGADAVNAMAVDSSYLYVVGYDSAPGNSEWRIEKRTISDSSLEYATTSNPSNGADIPMAMVIDDSAMYIAGYDSAPGNSEWRIEKRSLSDGSLVYATTSNPSGSTDVPASIVIDSDYMYLAGSDRSPGANEGRIEKRNLSDGSLVYATTSDLTAGHDTYSNVFLNDSYLYLAGQANTPGGSDNSFWIEKRDPSDGAVVYSTTTNFGARDDYPYTGVIAGSSMYLGGYKTEPAGTYSWLISQHQLSDGALVYSSATRPSTIWASIYTMASDGSNLYVTGEDDDDIHNLPVEKYDLNPVPTLTSFSPSSIDQGSDTTTLTINGIQFTNTSVVHFGSQALNTTYVTSSQLTAEVSASILVKDGDYSVYVDRPSPSYELGSSSPSTYTINSVRSTKGGGSSGSSSANPFPVSTSRPSSSSHPFTTNLQLRSLGSEVRALQIFLNTHGFPLASSGPGSLGQETDFFGERTKAALIRFQNSHLIELDIPAGTGFFGPLTRGVVNSMD